MFTAISAVFLFSKVCWFHTSDRRQSKIFLKINERGTKYRLKQCFYLPFVANWATNGNRKLCFLLHVYF